MLVFEEIPGANYALPESSVKDGFCRVAFAPSPHNGLSFLWFHVAIQRDASREALPEMTKITLKNLENMLGGGSGCFRPVMRTAHSDWTRMKKGIFFEFPDGRRQLEWSVPTPPEGDFLELAFCYPYETADQQKMLAETGDFWKIDTIGVTAHGRPILRLSNQYGSVDNPKQRGLYLICRQHAAETSGAWVLDGVLRRLAERQTIFPVWCVPFVDPDGVANGDYGKDSFPWDMNRAWGPGDPMRQEVRVVSGDLHRWSSRVDSMRSMILDFHSPGAEETDVYGFCHFSALQDVRPGCMTYFLEELRGALGNRARSNFLGAASYKPDSSWGSFWNLEEFCEKALGNVPALSVEISYWSAGGTVLTREKYREIGAVFADSAIHALEQE